MADKLSQVIDDVPNRTGGISTKLDTVSSRLAFQNAVSQDINDVRVQLNDLYKKLAEGLHEDMSLNPLVTGFSGRVIYTHEGAVDGTNSAYWDSANSRPKTVKQTFDYFLSEIVNLENLISAINEASEYDDNELRSLISRNASNVTQMSLDAFGDSYSLGNNGTSTLSFALGVHLEALGNLFDGWPGTGIAVPGAYPTLSFSVDLSNVNLDTTIPISTITDLSSRLGYIRTFIGKDTTGSETPTYSANSYVSDGDDLETAIGKLDAGVAALLTHANQHTYGSIDEIDGDKLAIDWSPSAYTPDTSITEANFAQELSAHLAGIANKLGSHAADHITGASDEIDGDKLNIDWDPVNYVPSTVTETTSLDDLSSHLNGIDVALASINGGSFTTTSNVTSNATETLSTDDFVFGSDQLDDDTNTDHDSRFLFDKSLGAFRAGTVTTTEWDSVNRGINSVAFGLDNTASNNQSGVLSGKGNTASGIQSLVGGGLTNTATATLAAVLSGKNCNATDTSAVIGGGEDNDAGAALSGIFSGYTNVISEGTGAATYSVIAGGVSNDIDATSNDAKWSFIGGGQLNAIAGGELAVIAGGYDNDVTGDYSAVLGGSGGNVLGHYSIIGGGLDQRTRSDYTAILGGRNSFIGNGASRSSVLGGKNHTIDGTLGGGSGDAEHSTVVGGSYNEVSTIGEVAHGVGQLNSLDGSVQAGWLTLYNDSASSDPGVGFNEGVDLFTDGISGMIYIASNSVHRLSVEGIQRDNSNNRVASFSWKGSILHDGTDVYIYSSSIETANDMGSVPSDIIFYTASGNKNRYTIRAEYGSTPVDMSLVVQVRIVRLAHLSISPPDTGTSVAPSK